MNEALERQQRVVEHLQQQYLGPVEGPEEVLRNRPNATYLVGVLYPVGIGLEDELLQPVTEESTGEDGNEEPAIDMANAYQPSSSALSFIHDGEAVDIDLEYATYSEEKTDNHTVWRRQGHRFSGVRCEQGAVTGVPGDGGVALDVRWRPFGQNSSLVTVAVSNNRKAPKNEEGEGQLRTEDCLYQVRMTARSLGGRILPYRSVEDLRLDPEQEELAVRYRHRQVFAVGHGTSVRWEQDETGACSSVALDPLPRYVVPTVEAKKSNADILRLDRLSRVQDDTPAVLADLRTFVDEYQLWAQEQQSEIQGLAEHYRPAAERITERQRQAVNRMHEGINLLEVSSKARDAFRLAMTVMREQILQSARPQASDSKENNFTREPTWRPFQLGFILVALSSTADTDHPDRDLVDLIWFPTGGGKTEAYLGLAAFEIFRRRLEHGWHDPLISVHEL